MQNNNFNFYDLQSKVFLITGSANGIGRCFAKCLALQGAQLILIDKDLVAQQSLLNELEMEFNQKKFYSLHCDLSIESEREKGFNQILQKFTKLDGIIHNAGIDPRSPIEKTSMTFLHKIFAVKFDAAVHIIQKLVPILKKSMAGRVLLMGSVTNELGTSFLSAYASANAAVSGLTRSLAHELGEFNITVNCINPGSVAVEKNLKDLKSEKGQTLIHSQSITRQIVPSDLFGLMCLLLSESGALITAQNITIDGGLTHEISKKAFQNEILGAH